MGPNTILYGMIVELNAKDLEGRVARERLAKEAATYNRCKKSSPVIRARSHAKAILACASTWLQVAAPATPEQSKSLR